MAYSSGFDDVFMRQNEERAPRRPKTVVSRQIKGHKIKRVMSASVTEFSAAADNVSSSSSSPPSVRSVASVPDEDIRRSRSLLLYDDDDNNDQQEYDDEDRVLVPIRQHRQLTKSMTSLKVTASDDRQSQSTALAHSFYQRHVLDKPELLVNIICNTPVNDLRRVMGDQTKDTIDVVRETLFMKMRAQYSIKSYLYAEAQTIVDRDFVSMCSIQALLRSKTLLHKMLERPFITGAPRVAAICVNQEGIGVRTLVKAKCHEKGLNLLVVDRHYWEPGMLTEVLQMAVLLQPCVVFFDHCEEWFCDRGGGPIPQTAITARVNGGGGGGGAYPPNAGMAIPLPAPHLEPPPMMPLIPATHGLELTSQMNKYTRIHDGTDDVWFLFSFSAPVHRITHHLRELLVTNYTIEDASDFNAVTLFAIAENAWVNQLLALSVSRPKLVESVNEFRGRFKEIFEVRHKIAAFTPSMILSVIKEVFTSCLRRTAATEATVPDDKVPSMADVDLVVNHMIERTVPGTVVWRGTM